MEKLIIDDISEWIRYCQQNGMTVIYSYNENNYYATKGEDVCGLYNKDLKEGYFDEHIRQS